MKRSGNDLYWIRSGLFSFIQNLSGVFFGFGSFYLLVRLLDKHDFGAWALFMSTATIMEIIRSGLVQNALIKFLSSAEPEEHPKIISSSFIIIGALTLLCVLFNLGFAGYLSNLWNSPELVSIFYLYNIAFVFSGILTEFNCIKQAYLDFKGIFISSVMRQALFFTYVLACFIFDLTVELTYLLYINIFTTFISMLVSYFYVRRYLKFSFKFYPEWIKRLFNYGKYAFGTSVSSIMAGTIDQMMLGAMLSTSASGAFNIAVRITNLVDIPTNAIGSIVFPKTAKRIQSDGKEAIKYLYERSVGVLMAILIPGVIFLFVFSSYVVEFISGAKYAETIPLLHITLLYCLFIPYGRQFGIILESTGRAKLNFFLVLTNASINIILNYLLIADFGIMGAAYASLLSGITGFLITQIFLKREFNVNLFNTLVYGLKFYPEFYQKYIKASLTIVKNKLEE